MRLPRLGFLSSAGIETFMKEHVGDLDLADLKIPVWVMASDLISGKGVALRSGSAARAVRASSSIPEIFAPVRGYKSRHECVLLAFEALRHALSDAEPG